MSDSENQEADTAEQTPSARTAFTLREKEEIAFLEGVKQHVETTVGWFFNPRRHIPIVPPRKGI